MDYEPEEEGENYYGGYPIGDSDEAIRSQSGLEDGKEFYIEELKKLFPQTVVLQVRKIGAHLAIGMSLKESCILALMDYDELAMLRTNHPILDRFFSYKTMTHKSRLMSSAFNTAVESKPTLAMDLLAQKYPEEFNRRATDPKEDQSEKDKENIMRRGIEHVREFGDSTPLVQSDGYQNGE